MNKKMNIKKLELISYLHLHHPQKDKTQQRFLLKKKKCKFEDSASYDELGNMKSPTACLDLLNVGMIFNRIFFQMI